ncbi:MAG: hypothetical protein U0165_19425 [Polyangiaceae bacterium]
MSLRADREGPGVSRDFPSDNLFVSNETSLLDVASTFTDSAQKGRAYVGVGPDQNFSYLALSELDEVTSSTFDAELLAELMVYRGVSSRAFDGWNF